MFLKIRSQVHAKYSCQVFDDVSMKFAINVASRIYMQSLVVTITGNIAQHTVFVMYHSENVSLTDRLCLYLGTRFIFYLRKGTATECRSLCILYKYTIRIQ